MAIEIFLGAGLALAAYPLSLAGIHLALALGVLGLAVSATTAAYGLYPAQLAADQPGADRTPVRWSENISPGAALGQPVELSFPFLAFIPGGGAGGFPGAGQWGGGCGGQCPAGLQRLAIMRRRAAGDNSGLAGFQPPPGHRGGRVLVACSFGMPGAPSAASG